MINIMRGPGSIPTAGNIFFCFHVVNPLLPILALLPFLCISGVVKVNWDSHNSKCQDPTQI